MNGTTIFLLAGLKYFVPLVGGVSASEATTNLEGNTAIVGAAESRRSVEDLWFSGEKEAKEQEMAENLRVAAGVAERWKLDAIEVMIRAREEDYLAAELREKQAIEASMALAAAKERAAHILALADSTARGLEAAAGELKLEAATMKKEVVIERQRIEQESAQRAAEFVSGSAMQQQLADEKDQQLKTAEHVMGEQRESLAQVTAAVERLESDRRRLEEELARQAAIAAAKQQTLQVLANKAADDAQHADAAGRSQQRRTGIAVGAAAGSIALILIAAGSALAYVNGDRPSDAVSDLAKFPENRGSGRDQRDTVLHFQRERVGEETAQA